MLDDYLVQRYSSGQRNLIYISGTFLYPFPPVMDHIFISHANPDSSWAKRLYNDLKNVGHDVRVDLKELQLGTNSIAFMNEALGGAHTVLILHSNDTSTAKWQTREIDAATWQEIDQGRIRLIVLRLDESLVPPLLGPKVYAQLTHQPIKTFLNAFAGIWSLPKRLTELQVLHFRRDQKIPSGGYAPNISMKCQNSWPTRFSPPAAEKIGTLEEMRPCFVEGSRGTGKTMLLMSLRARNLALRSDTRKTTRDLFGFYVRLTRGAFCNAGLLATPDGRLKDIDSGTLAQITDTFSQEFFVTLLESLLSEINYCSKKGHIDCEGPIETALTAECTD